MLTEAILPLTRPEPPHPATPKSPAVEPLLVSSKVVAVMIGVGESTFFRLLAKGEFGPSPVRLGGKRLYNRDEVRAWAASRLANGCLPDRERWEQMKPGRMPS